MDKKPPNERSKVSAAGRVPLDDIVYMGEKTYVIGNLNWSVCIGKSSSHGYNEIVVSTTSLGDEERLHVELEVCAPKYLPNRMTFWHVFDAERHAFCIPYISDEVSPNPIPERVEGKLQRGRPTGSYVRIALNPKIWKNQNWQFPFADLVLRIGNEELYVNRKILAATSRFFVFIMENSRVKCMKTHEVLHVRDVLFEDLYDLIGCIYHGWMFYSERAYHLQSVAEQFGIHLDANNTLSFEGRTSMEILSRNWHDYKSSRPIPRSEFSIQRRFRKLSLTINDMDEELVGGDPFTERHVENEQHSDYSSASSLAERPSVSPALRPSSPLELRPPYTHDLRMDVNHEPPKYRLKQNLSDDEYSDRGIRSRNEGYSLFSSPTNDGCTRSTSLEGRLHYHYSFEFDPSYSEKYLDGGKFAIQTVFGCWDLYLYPKMVNSEKYLALGIYGTRFSRRFINDVLFHITIDGGNCKKLKKVLQRTVSNQQNTLGYPTFLSWSDVLNYSTEEGVLVFLVKLSATFENLKEHPPLRYDMFPGVKDIFLDLEGNVIPVSRDVLSEASPILKRVFDDQPLINRRRVYYLQVSYEKFLILLDYIYNRKTRIRLHTSDYFALLDIAHNFEMQFVIDQICRELVCPQRFNEREALNFGVGLTNFMYKYYSQTTQVVHTTDASLIRKTF